MPKMKSKGAVKKRFRVTKNGKVKCSRPDRGHSTRPFNGKAAGACAGRWSSRAPGRA